MPVDKKFDKKSKVLFTVLVFAAFLLAVLL